MFVSIKYLYNFFHFYFVNEFVPELFYSFIFCECFQFFFSQKKSISNKIVLYRLYTYRSLQLRKKYDSLFQMGNQN